MRTSRAGLELIKSFEGFREQATRLPDGRWTIGYGHVRTAREGLTISPKDAEDLLSYDLKPVEDAIYSLVYAPLNQNQFDALVSLVFNISPGQFRESDILRNLNAGDFLNAAAGFDLWRKARIHGRVMVVDALVRRRAAEKAMFLEHPDGRPSAPTPLVTPEIDLTPANETQRTSEAAPVGQPRPRHPETEDEPPSRQSSSLAGNEIAEAVRRLAERTQEAVSPAPEIALPPGAEIAPPASPPPPPAPPAPPQPPRNPAETRRVMAERIGRILERTEREIKEQQDAEAGAEPPAAAPQPKAEAPKAETRPAPKHEVLEGLPDFDKPAAPPITPKTGPARDNNRRLIDDTDMFDPGRDPSALFAEAQAKAKVVNGRSRRFGPIAGRIVDLIPWIAILVLSLVGLGIGLVDTTAVYSATLLAVFSLLMLMSLYFLFVRRPDDAV